VLIISSLRVVEVVAATMQAVVVLGE